MLDKLWNYTKYLLVDERGAIGAIAATAATAALGSTLDSGGKGGSVKRPTPSPAETELGELAVSMLMEFYEQPQNSFSSVVNSFLGDLSEAEALIREHPELVTEKLTPITTEYQGKLDALSRRTMLDTQRYLKLISSLMPEVRGYMNEHQSDMDRLGLQTSIVARTPGTPIKYKGKEFGTAYPTRSMESQRRLLETQKEIAESKYRGGLLGLEQEMGMGERQFGASTQARTGLTDLASRDYQSGMSQAVQELSAHEKLPRDLIDIANAKRDAKSYLWDTYYPLYYSGKMGVGSQTTPYQPGFMETFLPTAGYVAGQYLGTNPGLPDVSGLLSSGSYSLPSIPSIPDASSFMNPVGDMISSTLFPATGLF